MSAGRALALIPWLVLFESVSFLLVEAAALEKMNSSKQLYTKTRHIHRPSSQGVDELPPLRSPGLFLRTCCVANTRFSVVTAGQLQPAVGPV